MAVEQVGVPYRVEITDTTTGETRWHEMDIPFYLPNAEGTGSMFWWGDGNFSCDCNRGFVWSWAAGGDSDFDAAECGEGRYKVKCWGLDGTLLYDDERDQ